MNFRELRREITAQLAAAGVDSPEFDAGVLLEHFSGISALEQLLNPATELPPGTIAAIRIAARRRADREPLQYLTGRAAFRNIELEVTPDVLIPRPETELLAGEIIRRLPRGGSVLDLGTGSGAIALAVAAERPDADVTAVDISSAALSVAGRNRDRLGLSGVGFLVSDLFSALPGRRFDAVAANLPYVDPDVYPQLAPEVRTHEPQTALTAPDHGFALIERTANEVGDHLSPGGFVIFELDPGQTVRLEGVLKARRFQVEIHNDLTGRARFVTGNL